MAESFKKSTLREYFESIVIAVILALFGTAWLAWSNGANDNFKGVATLYGSRSLTYRAAMVLAALATLGGGILAIDIADGLVRVFSGGGLVDGGSLSQATLAATAVAAASSRSSTATMAPSRPKASAMARPMPLPPPVTTQTVPARPRKLEAGVMVIPWWMGCQCAV